MPKNTLAQEVALAVAAGAELVNSNKFLDKEGNPVKVRPMELTSDPLEVGDEFTIPVDYQVIKVKFNENATESYPCIYVEVTSADGSTRNFRFFPNSLCKSITPIVDGKRQAKVKTTGSATDLFRTVTTVDEGLALLKGRKIRVTESTVYTIKDYTTKVDKDTHIYKYDLA